MSSIVLFAGFAIMIIVGFLSDNDSIIGGGLVLLWIGIATAVG